jgi:hypothetical protein
MDLAQSPRTLPRRDVVVGFATLSGSRGQIYPRQPPAPERFDVVAYILPDRVIRYEPPLERPRDGTIAPIHDELSQFCGYALEAAPTRRRRYHDDRPHTNRSEANGGGHHASMLCSGMHAGCQAINRNVKLCLSRSVGI